MRLEEHSPTPLDGVSGVAMSLLTSGTSPERVRVDVAVLDAGASLPKHPAGREQVFHVVSGNGRVAGDDDIEHEVCAGSTVTWAVGERHTSWADSPMTVVIIQRGPPD